mmetsp:Transcript_15564/g.52796  ORF Transcript_15564/g.52796 Transcript_15564/m.52796 type:complete len:114 (-) Transcript_15564:1551-1892(-)
MSRVKRGNVAKKRRKKVLNYTKGFKSSNSRLFRVAHQQYLKGLSNSYIGRKQRKRLFRRVWIIRINAMSRQHNTTYSRFISHLKRNKIGLDRKILSNLSLHAPRVFTRLVKFT